MKFIKTTLNGNFLITPEFQKDERGFFARNFCEKEFLANNLNTKWVQINNSMCYKSKTVRGLHYQRPPYQEIKLIRCIKGSIYDVVVDLRKNSKTYQKWFGAILSDKNRTMMYVPKGFAHGYFTLKANTEIFYLSSEFYQPQYEEVLLWSDPDLKIIWPKKPNFLSKKDSVGKFLKNLVGM